MSPRSPYRDLSLWHDGIDDPLTPRPALAGDTTVDVAIVGAGYTGLWTAYHLLRTDPSLRVAVLEKEIAGFGASGRNGGWCSAIFPATWRKLASIAGRDETVRLQRTLHGLVPEIGATLAEEGIDARFVQGGYLSVARNDAHLASARDDVQMWRDWGFGEDDMRLLDADETRAMAAMHGALGATWTPHCAVVDPQRLVRGLADAVERRGGRIYERTAATGITPRGAGGGHASVSTAHGTVRAEHVVLATEGYTPALPGQRRRTVPMYSLMVATEPLDEATWEQIGLAGRSTFTDKRHLRIYGQRTADGRIAFGGRGAPYHFGSRVSPDFDTDRRVHAMLERILVELFPVLYGVRFTHAWGGNLGVPRDWVPAVAHDPATGIGVSGGYVGDGVSTAALGGKTLAAMITGEGPEGLASLPWARRRSRSWEPEPLRWLGVNAVTALFAGADAAERRTGRPSRAASTFWTAIGH